MLESKEDKNCMKELKLIKEIAEQILAENPDPIVRFRLLRDVLKEPSDTDQVVQARRKMLKSHWILELKREQKKNGGWGRFHSKNHKAKRKIKTTEFGVKRGLALGLEATDPIFRDTVSYLTRLVQGAIDFPDPPERNDRWHTGVQLFIASTLAQIQPDLPILNEVWTLWANIARRTLASGTYNPETEVRVHRELTGASVKNSYLVLNNQYTLSLLGSRAAQLPNNIEKALVSWVWHNEDGVGYLDVPLFRPPCHSTPGTLDRWFTSIELLSYFPSWCQFAKDVINWLWTQKDQEELWDLGPRASTSYYFPLSESWRKRQNRLYDWSTRVLALLRKYYDPR